MKTFDLAAHTSPVSTKMNRSSNTITCKLTMPCYWHCFFYLIPEAPNVCSNTYKNVTNVNLDILVETSSINFNFPLKTAKSPFYLLETKNR